MVLSTIWARPLQSLQAGLCEMLPGSTRTLRELRSMDARRKKV